MIKKFNITVTTEQLIVLNKAAEEYMRLRMGQFGELAEDLASMGVDFENDYQNRELVFDRYIERMKHAEYVFDAAYRIARGDDRSRDRCADIAYELHQSMRRALWLESGSVPEYSVDGSPYLPYTELPQAVVRIAGLEDEDADSKGNR